MLSFTNEVKVQTVKDWGPGDTNAGNYPDKLTLNDPTPYNPDVNGIGELAATYSYDAEVNGIPRTLPGNTFRLKSGVADVDSKPAAGTVTYERTVDSYSHIEWDTQTIKVLQLKMSWNVPAGVDTNGAKVDEIK